MNTSKQFLFAVLMVMLLMTNIVWAGSEEAVPEVWENIQDSSAGNVLFIDNDNKYENMDRTYNDGYYPIVQDGTVTLVLPLVPSDSVLEDYIRVGVNLGDPTAAPFLFGNYDKTVRLENHSVNGGNGTTEAFLITVDIPLVDNPTMGRFPVIITAAGQWENGDSFSQEFPIYVTVNDGINPDSPSTPEVILPSEPEPESGGNSELGQAEISSPTPTPEETPAPQAKILLDRFSVNASPVMPGQEFEFSACFRNTNKSQNLTNVKITITGETADIVPIGENTGSFYFDEIASQETVEINMKMQVAYNAKAESKKIKFTIEYEGSKSTAYTATEEVIIQVKQPVRLEFDDPQIPKEVNAGDTISITMNVMNLGLGTVYNVRMLIEAPGLLPEKTTFMGNIESGEAKNGDLYVVVGTLDMTDDSEITESDNKYGITKGKVFLIYEDEYKQEYTKEFDFSTNINPPIILGGEEQQKEEKPKKQKQWWISVAILGCIFVTIVCIRSFKKNKRVRQQDDDVSDYLAS